MALLESVIQRDTRANQPAANTVAVGTLFCVTDESNIVERSNGTTWDGYSPTGGGTGDVVGPASAVTANLVTFNGTTGKLIQDGGKTIAGLTSDILAAVTVDVDAAGALDGDGSAGTPLAVRVDGSTITINGSNQLVAAGGGGSGDVVGPASAVDDRIATFDGITGKLIQDGGKTIAGVEADALTAAKAAMPVTIGCAIDGGGSAITTGIKGYVQCPVAGTITKAVLLADQAGSAVVDIWKDTYANYPPTDADSITASAPPTLSAAAKSEDTTLTGWTTAVSAGDVFAFNVDSAATITRLSVLLTVART